MLRLIVTEKNDAAQQIARLLSQSGKPVSDKVYDTPVYRFSNDGQDCITIGLRGHIMAPDFPVALHYKKSMGWYSLTEEGEVLEAELPLELKRPPFDTKRKPYLADGIDIKGWKVASLPYLIWAPIQKMPAEKGIIRALKNLAKKADEIVIATDFDREGELIGSDALRQMQTVAPAVPVFRARYSAFTKTEIDNAFSHLVTLDQHLADAGESRQYIDLIWGAVLTRYLTMARFGGLGNVRSAGRVQTPTLALVVEKERERKAFVPEDYWVIEAKLSQDPKAPVSECFKATHARGRLSVEEDANERFARAKEARTAKLVDIEKKSHTQRPPAPFNTTSLQAAAAAEGLSPARTMRLAESLYMEGYISYPRVDNTVYPASLSLKGVVKMLAQVPQYAPHCKLLLAQAELHATRGKYQTTDHPPIYPTSAASPEKLDGPQWKLYNLIARRFLATLSEACVSESTKLKLDLNSESFVASGSVITKSGFRAIYPYGSKKDELLPALTKGDELAIRDLQLLAKQTEPPARYSQGRLIQEMEKHGLGTKSTRASIIQRLFDVKYLKNDPVEPSQLGCAVIDALTQYAPHITSPNMTSELEENMTSVAEGTSTQEKVVTRSRGLLASVMGALIEHVDDMGEAIADAVTADAKVGVCPACGKDLVMKNSAKTRSSFVGCMGWPECSVTYPVPTGRIEPLEGEKGVCTSCHAPVVKVHPFRQRVYEICINPACPTNVEPDLCVGACSVCEQEGKEAKLIAHKSEKSGKRFIRCENYETCGTSYPLPQRGELVATLERCPSCNAPIVQINTERGPWRVCVNMNCPDKEKKASRGSGRARGRKRAGTSAKTSTKTSTKKAGTASTKASTKARARTSKKARE